jgi:hypothetical protein
MGRGLEPLVDAHGALHAHAGDEPVGLVHQFVTHCRPLPLTQQQTVGEPDHDLVFATCLARMEHTGTQAPGGLLRGGHQPVGPPQELGLPARRHGTRHRHRHRLGSDAGQFSGVEAS